MKIAVTGTRGIPDIQGGVETHCEQLYPRLARMGHEITVFRRKSYCERSAELANYRGVALKTIFSPRLKSLEAIVHTFLAVIEARRMKTDIVHIHAIGPSLMVPLARLLGMRVVVTNHGPDYMRKKWGRAAKMMLRAGEAAGTKYANGVIAISHEIADNLATKYKRNDIYLIANGVEKPERCNETDYIESLGLKQGKYVIALGRFVKEKGFDELINAWEKSNCHDEYKLVIAGNADHPDDYSRQLRNKANEAGVVLTGFVKGKALRELMSHAALFAMPSTHEGLPIALLEAMSYSLDVATSDINACKLPELDESDHYNTGNTDALTDLIDRKLAAHITPRAYDLSAYDWDIIACETEKVYRDILGG